jgi:hypothetical protein
MGFLDRLFGTEPQDRQPQQQYGQQYSQPRPAGYPSTVPPKSEDELAIERYRYLLRTAPPETIEQVHTEAFAKLTEQQRQQVLTEMTTTLPASERPRSTDPAEMARAATRAEYMQPGSMERTLGARQGPSFGSMVGSSLLGTVAGYVIGSALVSAFMAPAFAADQGATDGSSDAGAGDAGGGDSGTDVGADAGGWADASGGDVGGFGDFGGDFGF